MPTKLVSEGKKFILQSVFSKASTPPTSFKVGLFKSSSVTGNTISGSAASTSNQGGSGCAAGLVALTVTGHGWGAAGVTVTVLIQGLAAGGTTEALGLWTATIIDANTIALSSPTSAYAHAWVGGGTPVAILADTITLATLTEITGTNYADQALANNGTGIPTSQASGNDWQIGTATATFTVGGATNWDTALGAFIATTAPGGGGSLLMICTAGPGTGANPAQRSFGASDVESVSFTDTLTG